MSAEKEFLFQVRIKTSDKRQIETLDADTVEHALLMGDILGTNPYKTDLTVSLISVRDTDPREE